MTSQLGTANRPLRVAIIGSGPSGFYAAEHLQKQKNLVIEVDMFDRLPTPFGLVRGGVAPDHQKIKSVTKVYDRIASHPDFRFYGNVEFGSDLTREDLEHYYHAVIYAVGAQTDRRMDIPGEDLAGSHPATEFVAWYNAHPDFHDYEFDLSQENVAVVGLGNVAMDVIRILARSQAELSETDIADYAQEALSHSRIKNIYVLGRRGPAQSAFTNPEIKELGEMEDAEVIISPEEVALDEYSQEYLLTAGDKTAEKNVHILKQYADKPSQNKRVRIIMRFLVSPVAITGTEHVEGITVVKNELYKDDKGNLRPRPTGEMETIPVGLVFRSVGYHGVPLTGIPFYEKWGTIPNEKGRILTDQHGGEQFPGGYVVGWIKRGPSGVIGTNKPDSVETVESLLEDLKAGKLLNPADASRAGMEALLHERDIRCVTYEDWLVLDEIETQRGAEAGRPRLKFSRVEDMLEALAERKPSTLPDAMPGD